MKKEDVKIMSTLTPAQLQQLRNDGFDDVADYIVHLEQLVLAKSEQEKDKRIAELEENLKQVTIAFQHERETRQALQSPAPVSHPTLADPTHSEQQEPFMYAIQGPDGKAHFDDLCCAPNPEDLENEDGNGYHIVPVYLHPAPQPSQEQVLNDITGCFGAAYIEGLADVLAETTDERLKDLVTRRLLYAHQYALDALQSQPKQSTEGSEG